MGKAELDAFLTEQRTCRVATAGQDGPHLTPLWYVWDGTALWLYSVVRSQRWTAISRDRRVAFSSTPATRTANCVGLNCAARSILSARYRGQGQPTPGWQSPSGFTPASTKAPA
jgi:hypothetical protein